MKSLISVIVTTYNEQENIASCIESARLLTDDIIVVDTESTDNTVNIAKKYGATVYHFVHRKYVEPSRDFAINKARSEWVLVLDADERLTKNLVNEIVTTVKITNRTHFKIPRKNFFGKKKWLKYGGWYPDFVTRLIKKSVFIKWPANIHSTPEIKGEIGYLKNPLIHYSHNSLENMVEKTALFEDIESTLLYKAGKKPSLFTFFRKFSGELTRRFLLKKGFLDGTYGIIESIYQAYSKTVTYLILYEKNKKNPHS